MFSAPNPFHEMNIVRPRRCKIKRTNDRLCRILLKLSTHSACPAKNTPCFGDVTHTQYKFHTLDDRTRTTRGIVLRTLDGRHSIAVLVACAVSVTFRFSFFFRAHPHFASLHNVHSPPYCHNPQRVLSRPTTTKSPPPQANPFTSSRPRKEGTQPPATSHIASLYLFLLFVVDC